MTQSTSEARRQLVLILVAVAAGGVVFALTGDFVIGVGVAAGVFAIVRQAIRVWGPGRKEDDHPGAAELSDREPAQPARR